MTTVPVAELGRRAKVASRVLATASTPAKDAALAAAADLLVQRTAEILEANADDVARAQTAGTTTTVVDRLRLTPARVEAMAEGLHQVAALPDPVGEVAQGWTRPNGLVIERVRVPLGVEAILEHATVPYVIDGDGNCHVYVDQSADLEQALAILVNAKTQRPSVCNAAESLVVHAAVAGDFLPRAAAAMEAVELVGDERARALVPGIAAASDDDFATEFLDLKLSVAVVDSLDAAIDHVNRFGTGHTEAILTRDLAAARRFTKKVDA